MDKMQVQDDLLGEIIEKRRKKEIERLEAKKTERDRGLAAAEDLAREERKNQSEKKAKMMSLKEQLMNQRRERLNQDTIDA